MRLHQHEACEPCRLGERRAEGDGGPIAVADEVDGPGNLQALEQPSQVGHRVLDAVPGGWPLRQPVPSLVVQDRIGAHLRHRVGQAVVEARQVVDHQPVQEHDHRPGSVGNAVGGLAAKPLEMERDAVGGDLGHGPTPATTGRHARRAGRR